jgi:hypothetical protein
LLRKECVHAESPKECKGKIISAHTVQRSGSLTSIARSGHVYIVKTSIPELIETNGEPKLHLVGIREASVFNGFCAYHDRETFSPVENKPFTPCDEHCFLLGYRSLCKEYYAKTAMCQIMQNSLDLDRGLSIEQQHEFQKEIILCNLGASTGMKELEKVKNDYDRCLISRSYSDFRCLVLKFHNIPTIQCSSYFLL